VASEFWTSISPTLATGGKAIITSTPNSDEDQFAQIWKEANYKFDEFGEEQRVGRNGFFPFRAFWHEHPDRDEEWAATERSRIGEERFKREHDCEFLVYDETLVSSMKMAEMVGDEPSMRMGQCRWYKKINPMSTYMIALDPSLGTGGDPAAIQIVEIPSFEQVGEWQHNLTIVQSQVRILRDICNYINDECAAKGVQSSIYYSIENNSVGEAALVALEEIGEERRIYPHGDRHIKQKSQSVLDWLLELEELGAGEILLTSMDRDGTRDGFDIALTHAVSSAVGVPVIASGGVGTLDHLADGVLQGGATGVLAASIFHFGEHTIAEAKSVMATRGVRVRPVAS
jgi:hypothetical protein